MKYKYKPLDRASLTLHINQTAPLAAFTSGGLWIKLDRELPSTTDLSIWYTMTHACTLHLCICSMLTSALLMYVVGESPH